MQLQKPPFTCNVIILIIILVSFSYCKPNNEPTTKTQSEYREVKKIRVKVNFSQAFEIKEIKKGSILSDIFVSGIGFVNNSKTISFKDAKPLKDVILGDLNSDGFEELYLVTKTLKPYPKYEMHGITVLENQSYKSIYFPEFDKNTKFTFDHLNGYIGYDSIYIENQKLCRIFPIIEQTGVSKKLKGKRKIIYALKKIDHSFTIQVESYSDFP